MVLAACQDTPTTPIATHTTAASHRGPSIALASSSDGTVLGDVTYGVLRGAIRFWNTGLVSTQNGTHWGGRAFVHMGSAVQLTRKGPRGPVTNTSGRPGCIIEEYAAWIPPASEHDATPRNAGLWIGETYVTVPNPGAIGPFTWTTHAPTSKGVCYVGSGGVAAARPARRAVPLPRARAPRTGAFRVRHPPLEIFVPTNFPPAYVYMYEASG